MFSRKFKLLLVTLLLVIVGFSALPSSADAVVRVRGYTRKDGTYVAPHYRSDPDGNVYNNWSTKGNTNPYTGKEGTIDPYKTTTPKTNTYRAPIYTPAPSSTPKQSNSNIDIFSGSVKGDNTNSPPTLNSNTASSIQLRPTPTPPAAPQSEDTAATLGIMWTAIGAFGVYAIRKRYKSKKENSDA